MKAELLYLGNSIVIDDFRVYPNEVKRGNPYNTTFRLLVVSGSGAFSGVGECEYDIKKFRQFVCELQELYDFQRKTVELCDICYGSKVLFELNKTGSLEIRGTVYADAKEHSLTFTFLADQSVLSSFIRGLLRLLESV